MIKVLLIPAVESPLKEARRKLKKKKNKTKQQTTRGCLQDMQSKTGMKSICSENKNAIVYFLQVLRNEIRKEIAIQPERGKLSLNNNNSTGNTLVLKSS